MVSKKLEFYDVVEYPVITEKAVDLISTANRLTFIVNKKANKKEIKEAVEKMYAVKVKSVNVLLDRKNRKKALVTLAKTSNAQDVANKLGVL
ncbi:MAG: 50S ribosomal protein L23 [archaeon]|jgi:ribosomal protein uL23|nr:50S ribosomal protein L23 [archaeon]MDD2477572.1 50S ribosomal protein L23 [Candidatus ainarchaeum sp.]MDD3084332.1 50S ribosomal protein L23 [Candidatus ainarchaeum sp.]MDD4221074.1 50S ribosomal protein L23 [Candidatus ainarchaeum sp.]MDD4662545.1 50S ribosomal protein L23 [Candidatus ainarchaeum sp.]